jgi:hypothetical protein
MKTLRHALQMRFALHLHAWYRVCPIGHAMSCARRWEDCATSAPLGS